LWRRRIEKDGIQVKPGLIDLLDFVRRQRLPMAVATSSEAEYTGPTLQLAGLADRFGVVVTGDLVQGGKPEPDIYLETARRLNVPPSECVAFEDSEAGILAVERAGMTGILVPHWPATPAAVQAAFAVVNTLGEARDVLAALIET
jgi:HAD superfamily hydrolase (TIGR01509 family)